MSNSQTKVCNIKKNRKRDAIVSLSDYYSFILRLRATNIIFNDHNFLVIFLDLRVSMYSMIPTA